VKWTDADATHVVAIRLRLPGWARGGGTQPTLHVDGVASACVSPEDLKHYCEVLCERSSGATTTTLRLTLPFSVRTERLDDATPGVPASHALLAGPLVLAGVGESAFIPQLSHSVAATALPAAAFAADAPLVSLRLVAPQFRHRYLTATAAYAEDATTLLGYAVEPRRADVRPPARPAGGTGFHYSPPPSGRCEDAPDASAGDCTHLFLDAAAATFRAVAAGGSGVGDDDGGDDALGELRRGSTRMLEPYTAPGMLLGHGRGEGSSVEGTVEGVTAEGGALRLRLVTPPLELRSGSPDQGETVYSWPEGTHTQPVHPAVLECSRGRVRSALWYESGRGVLGRGSVVRTRGVR